MHASMYKSKNIRHKTNPSDKTIPMLYIEKDKLG